MELKKGTILKANGGWDAEVIFVSPEDPFHRKLRLGRQNSSIGIFPTDEEQGYFYAVHRCRHEVSDPVHHDHKGRAKSAYSSFQLPAYNGHPADLEMGDYEL